MASQPGTRSASGPLARCHAEGLRHLRSSPAGTTLEDDIRLLALSLFALSVLGAEDVPPTLVLGSPAPDFRLPGIDGKVHTLAEHSASRILAVVFTCNHCPTAQLYESRIKKLVDDYRGKSVAVVAIEPNNPDAVRLDEQGYTDMSDGLVNMERPAADSQ